MMWDKTGILISDEGKTIEYTLRGTSWTIESRKRHIPHANGYPGTWDHTTYMVLFNRFDQKEFLSFKDAKKYVEDIFV